MSIRAEFSKAFGKKQAEAIWNAAYSHANEINSKSKGRDPFKWALLICIGYQCMEVDRFREHHGITVPWPKLKSWIKKHASLHTHKGDCDYLALLAGKYNEYMPKKAGKAKAKP